MKTLRTAVALVSVLLMAGGYLASLYATFFGDTGSYVRGLDSSAVPWLALFLLVFSIVLTLVPDREAQS